MTETELHDRLGRLLELAELDPADFNVVEKEGDVAFEALRARIETLDPVRRARALSLLLLLTRQFCIRRLPDAIRTAIQYATSPDCVVRSAAVSAAARGSLVLPALRELERIVPEPPSREEVRVAIMSCDDAWSR